MKINLTFWYARFAQASFIAVGCLVVLPPLWAFIYLNVTGVLSSFELSFSQMLALSLIFYPKSVLTAFLIGLILAFRSATWGSISYIFTILTSLAVAFVVMVVTACLQYFWPQWVNDSGFGSELKLGWLVAWVTCAILYFGILVIGGFNERYQIEQRNNLIAAFWAAIIYAIFVPILYLLITVKFAFGDRLADVTSGMIRQANVEITAYFIAAILAFMIAGFMRRWGPPTYWQIFSLPVLVCGVVLLIRLLALPSDMRSDLSYFYIRVFSCLAFFMSGLSCAVFYLLGSVGKDKNLISQKTIWLHDGNEKKKAVLAAIFVFIFMLLVAPILWHFINQSLLAIFIGYPPREYWGRNIWIAYMQAGGIFGALVAIGVMLSGKIQFKTFFGWAIIACFIGALLPTRPFIISFGFFIDYIAWPMLSYLCLSIICWGLLLMLERYGILLRLRLFFLNI